jgi:nitrogen-specific signal transduction histidine kinase
LISEDIRSWQLTVENNGPEIPRDFRREIFLPGVTTKSDGHGNGLNIVRTLLQRCGGDVSVESNPDSTRFCCSISKPSISA